MKKKNVLLIDPHKLYLETVASIIEKENDLAVTGKFQSAGDALHALHQKQGEKPDVVIIDADMNEETPAGINHAAYITRKYRGIAVIVQSRSKLASFPLQARKANISGFVFSDCSNQVLLKAVRTVAAGKSYYAGEVEDVVSRYCEFIQSPNDQKMFLTRTETDILKWKSHGFHDNEVAENMRMGKPVFELHWRNILRKFDSVNPLEIVRMAAANGCFEPPLTHSW
ncbi:MAG: response regulator transcription factor [Bacteroidia bacterium]